MAEQLDTKFPIETTELEKQKTEALFGKILEGDTQTAKLAGEVLVNRLLGSYSDAKIVGDILRRNIAGDSYIEDKKGVIQKLSELSEPIDQKPSHGTNPAPVTVLLLGASTTFNNEAFNSLLKYTAIDGVRNTPLKKAFLGRGNAMSGYVDGVQSNWGADYSKAEGNLARIKELVKKIPQNP